MTVRTREGRDKMRAVTYNAPGQPDCPFCKTTDPHTHEWQPPSVADVRTQEEQDYFDMAVGHLSAEGLADDVIHLRRKVEEQARTIERLRAALEKIKRDGGVVCPDFTDCTHESCRSSYGAWAEADAALAATEGK